MSKCFLLLIKRSFVGTTNSLFFFRCSSIVYLKLGRHGPALASSADPHIIVRLPKHEKKAAESTAAKQSKVRKAVPKDGGEWLSAKPKAKRKKASAPKAKAKATKKVKTKAASKKSAASKPIARGTTAKKAAAKAVTETEIIEIASDDDSDDDSGVATGPPLRRQRSTEEALWSDPDSSEDEFEFD
jgi:hypothetical protein